ncbi:MAG TPA: sigma-70 family RNA polymerase sigma factor [Planctomycetota bacterium]|nr:sigma-70 family RNA polymerase sigma factor [Planctomycetota bacterium]
MRRVLDQKIGAHAEFEARLGAVERMLHCRNAQLGKPLSRGEVQDVIQDTVVVVLAKLDRFEGRASLETWMYRIGSLELLTTIRRKRRRVCHTGDGEAGDVLSATAAPDTQLPYRLRFEELYANLSLLKPEEERVLRLKHYEELDFAAVGREIGLTASGAKHHYYRALERLRQLMAKPGGR